MPTDKNLVPPRTRKVGLKGAAGGDVRGDNAAWTGGPPAVSPIVLGNNTSRAASFHPTTDYETEAPLGTSVFTDTGAKSDIPAPTVVAAADEESGGTATVTWTTPQDATINVQIVVLAANEFGDARPIRVVELVSTAGTTDIADLTDGTQYWFDVRRSGASTSATMANSWGPFAARVTATPSTV